MSVPAHFSEAAASGPASEAELARWWTRFHDPELSSLIGRALASSPTLEAAASRIRQARYGLIEAASREYPSVSANLTGVTLNSNRKAPAGPPSGGFALPSHLNLYSAGFDASWEVDLFGGTRRAVEAAKAEVGETVWGRRDGEVELAAEVASDYLALREVQARLALGRSELEREKGLFSLIQARRRAGFVTNLDVNRQEGLVSTAAAQIPQLQSEASARIHALGVLLGEAPEALTRELTPPSLSTMNLPPPPPELPAGLPSELLLRRPDLRQAERALAAANAEIGVSEAALFPKINRIGLASFAGSSLSSLFSSQNLSSIGLGMASQPVFNAGRGRAAVAAAKEARLQAELTWRNDVLAALRDVEDALAKENGEAERRTALLAAVQATRGSEAIAEDQYRVGLITFVNVLSAEFARLQAEDQLVQSDAAADLDEVALYKALGGGWSR
ncbi:MAG: efflux transporter outer membrane subunit [Caulobacteraceae bacterium]